MRFVFSVHSIPASRREARRQKKSTAVVAAGLASLIVAGGAVSGALGSGGAAIAADANPHGCGYGTVGERADQLCWIDMSSFDFEKAKIGQDMSISLPDGTVMTFTVTVAAGTSDAHGTGLGPRTVAAAAFPTWKGTPIGNAIYKNTPGAPALWTTEASQGDDWTGWADTIALSNIRLTKNGADYSRYSIIVADAESTDGGSGRGAPEGLRFSSDTPMKQPFIAQPAGYADACKGYLSPIPPEGATDVTCMGKAGDTSNNAGDIVLPASAPRTISAQLGTYKQSRQAIAFAVMFTQVNGSVTVNNDGTANNMYSLTASAAGSTLATASAPHADSDAASLGRVPLVAANDGTDVVFALTGAGSNRLPDSGYTKDWTCALNGQTVDSASGRYTVGSDGMSVLFRKAKPSDSVRCDATLTVVQSPVVINTPPVTGDASVTINPNQPATLTPAATAGTGALTGVMFDDGAATKVVAGEGSWSIDLVDGQPVASFMPEKDYHGAVTPQPYSVTDENGLSATGET